MKGPVHGNSVKREREGEREIEREKKLGMHSKLYFNMNKQLLKTQRKKGNVEASVKQGERESSKIQHRTFCLLVRDGDRIEPGER